MIREAEPALLFIIALIHIMHTCISSVLVPIFNLAACFDRRRTNVGLLSAVPVIVPLVIIVEVRLKVLPALLPESSVLFTKRKGCQ